MVVGADPFFSSKAALLAALMLRYRLPTVYQYREFTAAGGLLSYGGSIEVSYRTAGIFTGRILNGEKPADIPVEASSRLELIINLKSAKLLGAIFRHAWGLGLEGIVSYSVQATDKQVNLDAWTPRRKLGGGRSWVESVIRVVS
jgi:ABC-type uncharacterized transport system substrate-binding protein